ncbi:TNF receptor-associated factor 1 isoform X2 [Rhinoderma darwinii]|uniref:TNF receptor-associated factor 1 isoform X2 n=1 Tax=Rhinoderma darwinii TaxID=43563 RepID=UPI003F6712F5
MSRLRSDPGSNPHENEFVSGYPARICDHVPGNKYLCCNCNNVLKKAQQTLCGHRYCSPCLSWIVRNHKTPICPKCEEDPGSLTEDSYLTEDKAFSDTAINKEISELKVHCVTSGCQWSGVLGEYEKHNCEKTLSKDPNSRKSNIPTKSKNNQPDTMDCRFAPLGCIYRGSRDQIRDHEGLAAASHVSLVLPVLLQIQSARPAAAVKENGFCDYNGDGHKLPASIRNGESVDEEMATDCGSHNGGVTGPHLISRICALESRIQVAENIIMVMNREIDSSNVKRATALEESNEERGRVRACETKIADLRCTIAKKDMEINRLQVHLASLEQTSYDGIFLWKISDLTRKCQDAREGRTISLYSPAFYTAKYGYKVRLRVYLNGDGAGKGTHISLFFTVMRGEYDVLLPWPFKHKVTFMLLDQSNREHVIDAFRPDTTSISFQKPAADMNIASGCPLFCPLSKLHAIRNNYVVDETMFIRCIIDAN